MKLLNILLISGLFAVVTAPVCAEKLKDQETLQKAAQNFKEEAPKHCNIFDPRCGL